jgi:hypothetical protein
MEHILRVAGSVKRLWGRYCNVATPLASGLLRSARESRLVSCIIVCQAATLLIAVAVPRKASILPVGTDVVAAYRLLAGSPTGSRLIERACKAAAGSYIYLTAGETEHDRLFDCTGEAVRGLTRATVGPGAGRCSVRRVTVITNSELTGGMPREIAKSLAFELENICYLFGDRCACPDRDSPGAPGTRARVAAELVE